MNTFWKSYSWTSQVINSLKFVNQVEADAELSTPSLDDVVVFVSSGPSFKKCTRETFLGLEDYSYSSDHLGAL